MKTKNLVTLAATGSLVLTPLGLVPGPAAHAAPGEGQFTVYVNDWVTRQGLAGMQVTLYNAANGAAVGSSVLTSADDPSTEHDEAGFARITGLDSGSYTAKVTDPAGKHATKYTRVRPVDDEGYGAFDEVDLVPTTVEVGILSGTVTQSSEDNHDLDALVEVFPASATEAAIESGDVDPVARDFIYDYDYDDYYDDDSGPHSADWSIKVPGGQAYKVRISDDDSRICEGSYYEYDCTYTNQLWIGPSGATADNATSFSVAKAAKVAAGTRNLPVENVVDDRILGTVTGAGGAKLDDVDVELFKEHEHEGKTTWLEVASTETGNDGTFAFDDGAVFVWDEGYVYDGYEYPGEWDYEDWGPLTAGKYTLKYTDEAGEYVTKFLGNVDPEGSEYDYDVPDGVGTFVLGETGTVTQNFTMTRKPVSNTSGAHGTLTDDAGRSHEGRLDFIDLSGNEALSVRTRRDGTFSAPTTSLPPGQYKVWASSNDGSVVSGWVGGKTFKQARTLTVPVTGAANFGGTALARMATLAGTISVPAIAGTDDSYHWVTILGANGRQVDAVDTENGRFDVSVEPGTYYVAADGEAYSAFDSSDVGVSRVELVEQFWKGSYDLASATPVKVGSGGKVTGLDMALGNRLVATSAPKITGAAKKGGKLSVSTGSWNVDEGLSFSVVWKRGSAVVGKGTTYAVGKKDAGKTLTATVTATDTTATYVAGSSSATVKVDKKKKGKGGKNKRG